MKKPLYITVILTLLIVLTVVQPTKTTATPITIQTFTVKGFVKPTQPVGEIALKTIGIPNGTPAAARLSWAFNGFLKNATSTNPDCVLNVSQVISADTNKTITGGTITTPLGKVYAIDDDPYRVPAENETGNLYWSACFNFNFTLGNHYILNETWITMIKLTVRGNASLLADTNADLNIYNFTASAWKKLGEPLNTTTAQTHTYILTSNLDDYVDENNDNAIMIQFLWNDSGNTAYNVDIDYAAVTIYYNLTASISSWTVTQTNSTIELNKLENTYTVNFWDNFTVKTPSGITGHNFTMYIKPANKTYLTNHTLYVNGTQITPIVTGGEVAGNITNLVANSTALNFNIKMKVKFLKTVLSNQFWCEDTPLEAYKRLRVFNFTLTSNASAYYFLNLTFPTDVPYDNRLNATSSLGRKLAFTKGATTKIIVNYMRHGEKESVKFRYETYTKLVVKVVSSYTGLPIAGVQVTIDVGFEKHIGVTDKNGEQEFQTLIGGLSYTVTVKKGDKTEEVIVDVEWDKTTEKTISLPIWVLWWWLPYLIILLLIIVILIILLKKKIIPWFSISLPRISFPHLSLRKKKPSREKTEPITRKLKQPRYISKRTKNLLTLFLIFTILGALYISYTWRTWPFSTIPYTGEAMLKISAIPVDGITATPENYLYPVRYIVINPLNNMTIDDHYVGTAANPYVYVSIPKHPGYVYVAVIAPSEDYYLYEPLSSEYIFIKDIDNITYYKVNIPAPPLFQEYSEKNAIKITGKLIKVGNISIVDPGNITFTSTVFTSNLIFKLEQWTALYNATVKISFNISGIDLDTVKLNGSTVQFHHDDTDGDGIYDSGEHIYIYLANQTFLANTEDKDATYILSMTFSNATISSGQVIKATIQIYHYKFNPNQPFIFDEMVKSTLISTAAYYTKS